MSSKGSGIPHASLLLGLEMHRSPRGFDLRKPSTSFLRVSGRIKASFCSI